MTEIVLRYLAANDLTAKGISRSACEQDLLAVIAAFHRNRILERLGSSKATRSTPKLQKKWPIRSSKPILSRIEMWISNLQQKANRQRTDQEVLVLTQKAMTLLTTVSRVERETLDKNDEHAALISLIHAAFELSEISNGQSLKAQFNSLGFDSDFTDRREFREISAIANYGRICRYLAQAARSYRRLFRHISLNAVPHNLCTQWCGQKRFVHAEIQLLIDHEVRPKSHKARSIGTSKRACLLCYLFLRAYGQYEVPQTHGEVMPQWIVPDPLKYNVDSLERIRMALKTMSSDIEAANKAAASRQGSTCHGLIRVSAHSTERLHYAPLQTLSSSTLASVKDLHVPQKIGDRPSTIRKQPSLLIDAMPGTSQVDLASEMPPADLEPRVLARPPMVEVPPAVVVPEEVPTTTPITTKLSKASLVATSAVTSVHGIQQTSVISLSDSLAPPTSFDTASDLNMNLNEPSHIHHIIVSPSAPKILRFDGCAVHLQFEDLLTAQQDLISTMTASQPLYQKATCFFERRRYADPDDNIVDIAQISSKENIVLERKEYAKVLDFGLRGRSGQVVMITVQW